jgi:hypothetical protein
VASNLTAAEIQQQLEVLRSQFDQNYQRSANHSVWTRQHAIHNEIQRLEQLSESQTIEATMASLTNIVSVDLMYRIVNDLVRISDIVENRKIFGGITEGEEQAIKEAVQLGLNSEIEKDDTFESLLEYFRSHLAEIGPIMPVTGMNQSSIKSPAQNAAAGTVTNRPVTPAEKAANIAVQMKSLNPAELEKNISSMMQKDPNLTKDLNKSFATVLSNMIKNRV